MQRVRERVAVEHVRPVVWFSLAILMIFYLLSFLDKQMLSLLANPIEASFRLSDTRFGLLGFGFSITYTLGTIAAGILVDRYSPRWIIFFGVIVWCAAAAASGMATSYQGLFAARMGVGLGESVLTPAAAVLIVAMFPKSRTGIAMGTYAVGANIGGVIALLGGGAAIGGLTSRGGMTLPLLGYREPWAAALVLTGLPGIVCAFLIFAIRPSFLRSVTPAQANRAGLAVPFWSYLGRHKRFFVIHYALIALLGMTAYTMISWSPAYFGRAFGWSPGKIGAILAIGTAIGGFGNVLWGFIADRIRRGGHPDALYRLFPWLILASLPLSLGAFLLPDPTLAAILYPLSWLFLNSWGALIGALPFAVPNSLRGRATAIQGVVVGIVGIGLAPLVVGAVSDLLGGKPHLGEAIALVLTIDTVIVIALFWMGRGAYLAILESRSEPHLIEA